MYGWSIYETNKEKISLQSWLQWRSVSSRGNDTLEWRLRAEIVCTETRHQLACTVMTSRTSSPWNFYVKLYIDNRKKIKQIFKSKEYIKECYCLNIILLPRKALQRRWQLYKLKSYTFNLSVFKIFQSISVPCYLK
jgi:hypothetical protein